MRDSDGTLILTEGQPDRGTVLTRELAGALRVGRGQRVERDEDDEEDELERDLEPHSFSMAWNFSTLG